MLDAVQKLGEVQYASFTVLVTTIDAQWEEMGM